MALVDRDSILQRIEELAEQGWCLDCGKTGVHIAILAEVDDKERTPYIAGFYRYKKGRGVYAQGSTLLEAIQKAADLVE